MTKLRNGAKVLKRRVDGDKIVVLCDWNGEYVTWRVDNDNNAYWGHYFQNRYDEAVKDYETR